MPFKGRINKILTLEEFNELQKTDRDNRRTSSLKQSRNDQGLSYQDNTVNLAKRTHTLDNWARKKPNVNPVPFHSRQFRMLPEPGLLLDDLRPEWEEMEEVAVIGLEALPVEDMGPLFGMSIESVSIYRPPLYPSLIETIIVVTTGAEYRITLDNLELNCRIDPSTNEEYSRARRGNRHVATLDFDQSFHWFETSNCNTRYFVVFAYFDEDNYVKFEFRSDSLFFMTYVGDGGYFSYVHRNEIADPEWRKEWSIHLENVNPSLDDPHPQAKLHRMWTDGYGGSLHAYVCGLVDHFRDESTNDDETHIYLGYPAERGHRPRPEYPPPDAPASEFLRYYRQFDLYQFDLDGDLDEHDDTYYPQMAHMVFPPRPFDSRRIYREKEELFLRNPGFSGERHDYPFTVERMNNIADTVSSFEGDVSRATPMIRDHYGFLFFFNQVYRRSPWDVRAPEINPDTGRRSELTNCFHPRLIEVESGRRVIGYEFDPFGTEYYYHEDDVIDEVRRRRIEGLKRIIQDLVQEIKDPRYPDGRAKQLAGRYKVLAYFSGLVEPGDYGELIDNIENLRYDSDRGDSLEEHKDRGVYFEEYLGSEGRWVRTWSYIDHKLFRHNTNNPSDGWTEQDIEDNSWEHWTDPREQTQWNTVAFFQQSIQDTIDALKYVIDYHFDGFYIDTGSLGHMRNNNWYRTYKLFRAMRDQIKTVEDEDLILYHHNSIDPWGGHSGLRAIMVDCYSDFTLTGETHVAPLATERPFYFDNPDNAGIENPDENYMRYFVSGYGLSQAICSYLQRSNRVTAVSWYDGIRSSAECLRGTTRNTILREENPPGVEGVTVWDYLMRARRNFDRNPDVSWGTPEEYYRRIRSVNESSTEYLPDEVEITLTWPKMESTEAVLTYTRCDDPAHPGVPVPVGNPPLQVWWRAGSNAIHHGPDGVFYQINADSPDDVWSFTLKGQLAGRIPDEDNSKATALDNAAGKEPALNLVREMVLRGVYNREYQSHPNFVPSDLRDSLENLFVERITSGEWVIRYLPPYENRWWIDIRSDLVAPALFTIIKDASGGPLNIYQGLVPRSRPRIYKYRIRATNGYEVWGTVNMFDHYAPD